MRRGVMKEPLVLKFQGHDVRVIEVNGENCIPAEDLGRILGFSEPRKSVNNIFNRYRDEIEPHSSVINLMTEAGLREVRVFNETGAYLVAMFARTPKAKEVRLWLASLPKRLREFREAVRRQMPAFTLEDVRRVVREEMAEVRQEIELARKMAFAEGIKAGIEIVRRYEKNHLRPYPAHFLSEVLSLGGVLSNRQIARLTGRSARAVSRARKLFAELGVEPEAFQLPLFQKSGFPRLEMN
ncbi:MAG TPA: hypothetical protein ENJ40_03500 [Thermosulfurimonas dismutans]|uniref:Bro-N domain-containing protein n=1 Tax=Thermosulfurimonas dismutans TaxID=999894 RepID=A0A7C3CL19_9BACT|nr:hypothetical protein [Thermosulfurimonas dismutans]